MTYIHPVIALLPETTLRQLEGINHWAGDLRKFNDEVEGVTYTEYMYHVMIKKGVLQRPS